MKIKNNDLSLYCLLDYNCCNCGLPTEYEIIIILKTLGFLREMQVSLYDFFLLVSEVGWDDVLFSATTNK